jgi:hypothetical protein
LLSLITLFLQTRSMEDRVVQLTVS